MRLRVVLCCALMIATPFSMGAALDGQDDAGSGRDAPGEIPGGIDVAPGVVHLGRFDAGSLVDRHDVYRVRVEAGQAFQAKMRVASGCLEIYGPDRALVATRCTQAGSVATVDWTVLSDGTAYLRIAPRTAPVVEERIPVPSRYAFAVGLDAPAPTPGRGGLRRADVSRHASSESRASTRSASTSRSASGSAPASA